MVRRWWFLCGLIFALAASGLPAAADGGFQLAYIEQRDNLLTVYAVDPANPVGAKRLYTLAAPGGLGLKHAYPSPNGAYAALGFGGTNARTADALVMLETATGRRVTLGEPAAGDYYTEMAWDRNGGFRYRLPYRSGLEWRYVVYDPVTGEMAGDHVPLVLCPTHESPNHRFVAWITYCETPTTGDVNIWSAAQGMRLATDYGVQVHSRGVPQRESARYALAWLDDQRLAMGVQLTATYGDSGTPGAAFNLYQTGIIDAETRSLTLWFRDTAALEWAINPVDGRLAYRMRQATPEGSVMAEAVQVAKLVDGAPQVLADYPPGCDQLAWSPDGAWLSYRPISQYCWEQPVLTIIDGATLEASRFVVAALNMQAITWIGWIARP